jgi:hypothetical protein
MNNLNDSLPDLMRRATDDLEPESNDLVERGIQRGVTLRRRRTAMLSLSGAGAVLATAGIIVGGTQLFAGSTPEPTVAGPSAVTTPSAKVTASPAQTLATLRALTASNGKQSAPGSRNDNGMFSAEVVLDDGKGASLVTVQIVTTKPNTDCAGLHGTCQVRSDGSVIHSYADESIFPYENSAARNPNGIKNSVVEVFYPDGRLISLYSYNAPKQSVRHTRTNPLLTVQQLTAIANSDQWVYPPALTGAETKRPGNGKPTVPLEQTQQMLKSVLPNGLQLTRPETWGGDTSGHNSASYVVNDGKGAAMVDVLVQYETPVTKCTGEGPQHCKVRPDGSVTGWSRNEPTYGDERQAINGVLANRVEIHYPDGRMITMTSYNGPSEKDDKHTRALPTFSTAQLLTMAGKPGWKFPGTGTK